MFSWLLCANKNCPCCKGIFYIAKFYDDVFFFRFVIASSPRRSHFKREQLHNDFSASAFHFGFLTAINQYVKLCFVDGELGIVFLIMAFDSNFIFWIESKHKTLSHHRRRSHGEMETSTFSSCWHGEASVPNPHLEAFSFLRIFFCVLFQESNFFARLAPRRFYLFRSHEKLMKISA